jgi:hypothetical protein
MSIGRPIEPAAEQMFVVKRCTYVSHGPASRSKVEPQVVNSSHVSNEL